jgi:ADP-ribosylglycohydrolase
MSTEQQTRARNCILGAVVADAASMGLHWVYSQRRISELAPEAPEFREPDERDYDGGVGYFAHGTRHAGDLSHYGEQMLVMLRSLAATGGRYEKAHYQEQFRRHFGYGGGFVGYIDRPTRQTLDRIYRDENTALEAVDAVPFEGDPTERQGMLTKVLAAAKRFDGQRLRDQVEQYAAAMPSPEASRDYGLAAVDALAQSGKFPGALDDQLPAVSKLPPLVACHADDADLDAISESAIKVTNNSPRSLDFGRVCSELLRSAVRGDSMASTLEAGIAAGSAETRELLAGAVAMNCSVREATREFGLHCDLGSGVPSLMHNLARAESFTDAIRQNILAGGDNCGRAIVLGAVCGAQFGMGGEAGIPLAWLERVNDMDRIRADVEKLVSGD